MQLAKPDPICYFSHFSILAFALLISHIASSAAAADATSKGLDTTVSCTRNYRDSYAVEAKLQLKAGSLVGLNWNSATDKGHTCGVTFGTLRHPESKGKGFFVASDTIDHWYLIDSRTEYCAVHIQGLPGKYVIREAFPGSCKAHCGANGRFETTVVNLRGGECDLPRLDQSDKIVK